jgi:hypothetical protein
LAVVAAIAKRRIPNRGYNKKLELLLRGLEAPNVFVYKDISTYCQAGGFAPGASMAYGQDLAGSARRHLTAATFLHSDTRRGSARGNKAVAGYLFGVAGELALKQMMAESGMQRLDEAEKREDPMFAHFPKLKTFLLDTAQGRRQGELLKYAKDSALFRNWDTKMRYAPTSDITDELTTLWKSQAEALVSDMGL